MLPLDAPLEIAQLSLGQQQLINIARMLIRRPRLALLDEATSHIQASQAVALYYRCKRDGITVVSVSHQETELRNYYHTQILRLLGEGEGGAWRIETK